MTLSAKQVREYIVPKLAEAVVLAGRFKRPECAECQRQWQLIQDWFDERERERLQCIKRNGTKI